MPSIFTWLKLKFLKQPLSVFLLKDTTSCERLTQRFKVLVFVQCECFILLCYVTASHISGFIYSEEANIHMLKERILLSFIYLCICFCFFKSLLLFIISETVNQFAFTLQNLSKCQFYSFF